VVSPPVLAFEKFATVFIGTFCGGTSAFTRMSAEGMDRFYTLNARSEWRSSRLLTHTGRRKGELET